jgi:hypothetical protein
VAEVNLGRLVNLGLIHDGTGWALSADHGRAGPGVSKREPHLRAQPYQGDRLSPSSRRRFGPSLPGLASPIIGHLCRPVYGLFNKVRILQPRRATTPGVKGAHQHQQTALGQLAGDVEADALARARWGGSRRQRSDLSS